MGLFQAATAVGAVVFAFHLLEAACHLLVTLVFQHLPHELFAVFVVFFDDGRVTFFGRQQFLDLQGHEAACHVQKIARLGKVGDPNLVDPHQKIVGNFGDRNLVQGHFLFLDQVQKQIHRAVEGPDAYFVIFLFFDIGHCEIM